MGEKASRAIRGQAQGKRHPGFLADARWPEEHRRQEEDQHRVAFGIARGQSYLECAQRKIEPPETGRREDREATDPRWSGYGIYEAGDDLHEAGRGRSRAQFDVEMPAPILLREVGPHVVIRRGVSSSV